MSVEIEVSLKLEMAPVVKRVSDCFSQHLGPLDEFIMIRSIAGAVLFLHTAASHVTPLVVISAEPDL